MIRAAALSLVLAAVATGCQCFAPTQQLTTFRVLGVAQDPLAANPGDTVTLTLATADTHARDVAVAWYLCPALLAPIQSEGGPMLPGSTPADCVQQGAFATGTTVTLAMPAGVPSSYGDPRPAVDLVGYACAGGAIGAPSDPASWPSCNGLDAQGFLFTRRLHGPAAGAGTPAPTNPAITEVRFGAPGALAAIDNSAPPTAPRCEHPDQPSRCEPFRFEVALTPPLDPFNGPSRLQYSLDGLTLPLPPGTNSCPVLPEPDAQLGWTWTPPSQAGRVHLFVFLVDPSEDGFAWTERDVVVQ